MESYVLAWPQDENWKISRSSVEGDGRTVAFELRSKDEDTEDEKVLQLVWLARKDPDLGSFWEQWLQEFQKSQEKLSWKPIALDLSHPSKVFGLEGLQFGEESFDALGFMASGRETVLLHLHFIPRGQLTEKKTSSLLHFFQSLEFKSQSLRKSFEAGGLMPAGELDFEQKNELPKESSLPEQLRSFAHPPGFEDVPYWKLGEGGAQAAISWARVLKQSEPNLFIAADLSDEKKASMYLRWDEGRQAFFHFTSQGLAMKNDINITPCKGCKFQMLDPEILDLDQLRKKILTCPFCGHEIEIHSVSTEY